MNWEPNDAHFRSSLRTWTWRGVLCALPSFIWATMGGFNRPAQLIEMLLGVAVYVVGFAWLTALPTYVERVQPTGLGWAFRVAANSRAALAPLMFFGPDFCLGAWATTVVGWCIENPQLTEHVDMAPIGVTCLITIVQGAFVSTTMAILALLIWAARELWRLAQHQVAAMCAP